MNKKASSVQEKIQAITFEIEQQKYGVDIRLLDEILPMMEVRPLPKAPSFLKGVINLRGDIIPIVDLREQFGHKREVYRVETRIMIATFLSRRLGFIVDGIRDIENLECGSIQATVLSDSTVDFVSGMARFENGSMIQLIAIDKILSSSMLEKLSELKVGNDARG